jgi:hypothetical protein
VVEFTKKRCGLDTADGGKRLIVRTVESGMAKIDGIIEIEPGMKPESVLDDEYDLYFSVPETDAIIKRVNIPESGTLDPKRVALFEFSQTLLDPPDAYYTDVYDLNGQSEKLTVGYNRACVDEKIDNLTGRFVKPSGFRLRSLALADGYRYFCKPEGGELVCLLDICASIGSYCFLWNGFPTHPGLLYNGKSTKNINPGGDSRFAIDLAATLKFQLATLFSSGRSVPLSRIFVSGTIVDDSMMKKIESLMKVTTSFPTMKDSSFAPEMVNEARKHLVGLGLTAEI